MDWATLWATSSQIHPATLSLLKVALKQSSRFDRQTMTLQKKEKQKMAES
jgi:hypothetical protein